MFLLYSNVKRFLCVSSQGMTLSFSSKLNLANENIHIFCVEVSGFAIPALLSVSKMQHHFFFFPVFCYILVVTSVVLFFPRVLQELMGFFFFFWQTN